MKYGTPTIRSDNVYVRRTMLGYFVLVSLVLHALAVALWRGEPPTGPVGHSTFRVTLLARRGDALEKSGAAAGQVRTSDSHVSVTGRAASSEHSTLIEDQPQKPLSIPESATSSQPAFQAENGIKKPAYPAQTGARKTSIRAVEGAGQQRVTEIYQALAQEYTGTISGSTSHGQHEFTSAAKYQKIRAELLKALLPYFEYPAVARRRGWQGRVKIGLLVEADGDLSGVHLVESSGYALLDKAAVKNVIELSHVPGATQWLDGNEMDVILPVNYRLQDR